MSSGTREGHGRVSGCANRVCLSFAGEYSGERRFSGRLFGVGGGGAIDYFPLCPSGEVGDRHLADVALAMTPHSHPPALPLAVTDDEHVGHLPHLAVADLLADGLGPVVDLDAQAGGAQL